MAQLYGREMKREEILRRVGSISQIAEAKRVILADGNEAGVEAIYFRTGSGFNFTVLPGRGMDISLAEYAGQPLCWRSSTGDVAPAYYEPEGLGFLRTFYGGMLVTCGLTQTGPPCEDEGEQLGLHGRIHSIPAGNVCVDGSWEGDEYHLWARGKVRETRVFGENVTLSRTVKTHLGATSLQVEDVVTNEGFEKTPHCILYHINPGFPVVDEGSELLSASLRVEPRDEEAKKDGDQYHRFSAPQPGYKEKCYFHDLAPSRDGYVYIALINRSHSQGEGLGVYLKFRKEEFPEFCEWKMMGEGTYVVGIEPGNAQVAGRAALRRAGTLPFLEPGEKRQYNLEIGVLAGRKEIAEIEKKIKEAGKS